jgi:hypothetical protein
MLTSRIVREQVPVPGDDGAWVTLRALGGTKLREASQEKSRQQLMVFKAMGADGIKAIQEAGREQTDAALKADPLAAYDIDTLIRAGIVGWSYYQGKPKVEDIDSLDDATQEWAATEILKMSKPQLWEMAEMLVDGLEGLRKNL